MRLILQTLRFPKPPSNITIKQLFDKLDTTIPLVLKKAGADLVGKGIFSGFLSDKQWEILKGVHSDLHKEYKIRREMMLTRLDVTIQSFQWSDRTKGKDELFEKIYHDKRKSMLVDPNVGISDLIAARTDLAIIEKTSSASVRKNTQTPLNKVIIGQVSGRKTGKWEGRNFVVRFQIVVDEVGSRLRLLQRCRVGNKTERLLPVGDKVSEGTVEVKVIVVGDLVVEVVEEVVTTRAETIIKIRTIIEATPEEIMIIRDDTRVVVTINTKTLSIGVVVVGVATVTMETVEVTIIEAATMIVVVRLTTIGAVTTLMIVGAVPTIIDATVAATAGIISSTNDPKLTTIFR